MGFYIRRSVKAGPIRFNLSKSGIGVSAGVRGFRVGTGPRGNYVSVGRNGLYYRKAIGSGNNRAAGPAAGSSLAPLPLPSQEGLGQVAMQDVSGATALTLEPTGPGDVVDQLNAAAKRRNIAWPAVIVLGLLGLLTMPAGAVVWLLAVPLCWWLFRRDAVRRTVVVMYDVHDAHADWLSQLVDGWAWLSGSQALWREIEAGNVVTAQQRKTNAGAGSVVNRVRATATLVGPKHLATNVAVPSIVAGNSSIHLLPDRILIREGKHYADVDYQYLSVDGYQQRFIESPSSVPSDALQIGQTWQYVNANGGPDRRYKNNPVLPVMLYGGLNLTSPQGLSWVIQVSRESAGTNIAALLRCVPRNPSVLPPPDNPPALI